jgi:Uma2 family endonuclease
MAMAITIPRYTVADLDAFPNDGNRYELLDGMLLVTPAPRVAHQIVVGELQALLRTALGAKPARGRVVSPGSLTLPPSTHLEPDILVFPTRVRPYEDWDDVTERWLAVEVYSPSTRYYDRDFKRDAYLALGLREVWLIDPFEKTAEVCRAPGPGEIVRDAVRWRVPTLDIEVSIDLAEIFAGVA